MAQFDLGKVFYCHVVSRRWYPTAGALQGLNNAARDGKEAEVAGLLSLNATTEYKHEVRHRY